MRWTAHCTGRLSHFELGPKPPALLINPGCIASEGENIGLAAKRSSLTSHSEGAQQPVGARQSTDLDEGLTLVEMMVAIFIISVGLLALVGELAANLHGQIADKRQAVAVRLATTSLEDARNLSYTGLSSLAGAGTSTPTTINGTSYATAETVQLCAASAAQGTCTSPASGAASDVRVQVVVSWLEGTKTRKVLMASNVSDTSEKTVTASGSGTLGSLLGGSDSQSGSVVLGVLTVSPTTSSVDSSGHPASSVTATLNVTGLTSSTTFPLTYSDDNGSHQVTMSSSGSNTWSATISSSNITKSLSGNQSGSVTFAATVPNGGIATASLSLVAKPAFVGNCTVSPNPIVFQLLTTKTSSAETLTCTTSGLAKTDSVTVSYPKPSGGTGNGTLTSTDGSTWTLTLPSGTTLKGAPNETFTFSLTRVSDGVAGSSQNVTVLAA
jgi:trimeric autotransporter adhesin